MSGTLDLERRLATWLEQDGPADVPAAAVDAALAQARTIRQPRVWLTRTWWDRRPLVAAPAPAEAGVIEPSERIPTFAVARPPLRPAWVLLLLAGLLATLVGGALLVGSQQQRRLPAVVPPVGQVYECPPGSTPDEPGPVDQARPDMGAAMAFDRRAGRLVALTVADSSDSIVETWTFDVCTNTWTRMHPNREPPGFEWAHLVYDVDSDVTLLVSSGRVWAYDLQANTWTEKGVVTDAWLWAYDPLSGLVVAQGGPDPSVPLSTYDVETDTWTPIHEAGAPETGGVSPGGWPAYGPLVYDASVDRIVALVGTETWLFDMRTGRWSAAGAEAPDVIEILAMAPTIIYDEAAERTVVIGDVRMAAYDATADRWQILAEADPGPAKGFRRPSVYDPVNGRLVGWLLSFDTDSDELFAFDLATREWTVLLAASETQPRPAGASLRPLDLVEGSPHAEP